VAERLAPPLPVWLFLICAFMPIAFRIGPLYMTGVRVLLIAMIVPLGFNLISGKYGRLIATDILFSLYVGWIIIAMAINSPEQVVQNAGATGIEFLGGYLLGRAYIRTSDDMIALIRLFAMILLICLPFAVIEAITGSAILMTLAEHLPGLSPVADLAIPRRLGLERVQMAFEHPIHWGLVCAIGVSFCFIGLAREISCRRRLCATAAVCIGGLLALSSGAILAIALQLGLILWAAMFRQSARRWLILIALSLCLITIVDLLSSRSPLQVFMTYATFSAHSAYWRSTIFDWGMVNVWANPIFGLGLRDWVRPVWMHGPSVDNFWLLTTMRFGVPAFLFLISGYLIALLRIGTCEIAEKEPPWPLRRAWMFCFIAVSFALTTVHVWGSVYALVFFFFGAGMWMYPNVSQATGLGPRTERSLFTRI